MTKDEEVGTARRAESAHVSALEFARARGHQQNGEAKEKKASGRDVLVRGG